MSLITIESASEVKEKQQKPCKVCGSMFRPFSSTARVCSPVCARKIVKADKKAEKVQDRAKRESQKPIKKLKAEAQKAFNEWIRMRDADQPCISCDTLNPPMKPGGAWDAGHFISRGSHPELAFDEDNVHKQCKTCNAGGGKYAHKERTVNEQYEERLIARIGAERVERLKGPHEVTKLDREVLRQIKVIYRAKTRDLRQGVRA